jgi:hypothetical protein
VYAVLCRRLVEDLAVDWVRVAPTILPNELITRKKWYAWYVMTANNLLWLYVCYGRELWAFFSLTVVMKGLGILGLVQ